MPFLRLPLVSSHSSSPGVALRMRPECRSGFLSRPVASLPWQAAQFWWKSFAPAAIAWGSESKGLCLSRSRAGTFCFQSPSPTPANSKGTEISAIAAIIKKTSGFRDMVIFPASFSLQPGHDLVNFIGDAKTQQHAVAIGVEADSRRDLEYRSLGHSQRGNGSKVVRGIVKTEAVAVAKAAIEFSTEHEIFAA